jgi:FixJ family two-component response regulator
MPLLAVIDDDSSVRIALSGLLRSHGYRVETFASAEAYLASSAQERAGCVVCDIQLPGGMSGIELMRQIATPVILMTAFASEAVLASAAQAGAVCLLRKPFGNDELTSCLARAGV